MYEMKDEYLTGIAEIDNEHRKLFEIANEAYELQNDTFIPDKYDYIKEIFNKLKEYTIMHFEHEEAYMESINYKKMFIQKVEHDAFRKRLDEIDIDSFDEEQDELITELLKFLTDWLVSHILENDKQIALR